MSAPADAKSAILLSFLSYSHTPGAVRLATGRHDPSLEALLHCAAPLLRSMLPWLPDNDGLVQRIDKLLTSEPLTIVFAVEKRQAKEAAAAAEFTEMPRVYGAAIIRVYRNTFNGVKFLIESMFTAEEYRSRGVGRQLFAELQLCAAELGSTEISLQVDTLNQDAARFFTQQKMLIKCFAFKDTPKAGEPRSPLASSPPPAAAAAASSAPIASPSASPVAASPSPPPASFSVVHITDASGRIINEAVLAAAQGVHLQLRPALPSGAAYLEKMTRIFAEGGRMVAAVTPAGVVLGVSVFRSYVNSASVVTDSTKRSQGVGLSLLQQVRADMHAIGIPLVQLDSGVQRRDAHRFYFNKGGMHIDAFSMHVNVDKV